jgi:hypothetical protein
MRSIKLLLAILVLASAAFAQNNEIIESYSTLISSGASTVNNYVPRNNTHPLSYTIEQFWSSAPTGPSIVYAGCMRGDGVTPTCVTLQTVTTTVSGITYISGLYDFLRVTSSWTGAVTLRINIIGAANSTSGNPVTPTASYVGTRGQVSADALQGGNIFSFCDVNLPTNCTGFLGLYGVGGSTGILYDRLRTARSLTEQVASLGALLSEKGFRIGLNSAPAAGSQATASVAAGGAAVKHVVDCVSYSASAIVAPTATLLTVNVRDGATGAGTVIWTKTFAASATAATHADGNFCGLNIPGSLNTAMTVEFSAGLTSESESVSFTYYDLN